MPRDFDLSRNDLRRRSSHARALHVVDRSTAWRVDRLDEAEVALELATLDELPRTSVGKTRTFLSKEAVR